MRPLAGLLAVAALVVGGIAFSGAAFTAVGANSGNDFATAAVFPTVTMTDPGTPLRGTVTLDATTTGTIVSVTIQRSPAGAGSWTNVCTDSGAPYSCSFDSAGVGDGLYDLRASADHGSGSVISAVVADRRVDNTAPAVAMTDPGSPLSGTITLQATATDIGGSGVSSVTIQRSPAGASSWTDVCTDGTSPYSCSFDTTTVGDALYDFRAVGSDIAGNSANSTVTNRRIDNVAPTASLTDPGTPLRGTVTLDATASDGGGIANVKIQRSPAGLGTWTDVCTDSTSPYSCSTDTGTWGGDGLYDLRAVATDNASRSTSSTVVANRRVDNTAPAVAMTDPGSPLSGTITLQATATDIGGSGVSSVTIQRSPAGASTWTDVCTDGTSPYSCSLDSTTVTDALYDFRAVGSDTAGNSANSTVTNRRIDNVAPTVSLTDPGANIRGTISLDATASDGGGVANVKIQRSPAGLGTWTDICTDSISPYSCPTDTSTWGGDGLYDLRAIATDNASRTSTSTVANRRVDNTLPTVSVTDPGANIRGTITLQATASDTGSGISSVTIQRSPASLNVWTDVCTDFASPYSCSTDTTTWGGDGLYDLRAVTIDVAGNPNTSATVANRRVDNTAPVTVLTDPGAYLRGTITLNATGTDTGGSGVANVTFQRSPVGLNVWTDLCPADTTSPYSCLTNTATWGGDGVYDVRSFATDNAGNTTASVVGNRTVDNTAPTATNIQAQNKVGGTAGQAEQGDTVTFTFSEQIAPGTIVGGWNGTGNQTVTVTLTPTTLAIAGATLVTGTISLPGGGYALNGKSIVFSNSTISQAGATLTVTLGTPDNPQWLRTGAVGQMSWPVAAALTDLAGNAITTVTRLEVQPPNDAEF